MTTEKKDLLGEEEHALLSPQEVAEAKAKARKEILDANKKAAMAAIVESEKTRLKTEEGLIVGNSHKDEMVQITLDLAPYTADLKINGQSFWHGRTYTVPRHQADTLREMMFRTWDHERTIKGDPLKEFYAQKHIADLYRVKGGKTVVA